MDERVKVERPHNPSFLYSRHRVSNDDWFGRCKYVFDLWSGVYMLDWWEAAYVYAFGIAMFWLVLLRLFGAVLIPVT